MASRKDKDRMLERFARGQQHELSREEQQRRLRASKARRAGRHEGNRGQRHWDEDSDEDAGFEKIPRQRVVEPVAAREVDPELPRATVAAVHRGRLELEDGRSARITARLHLEGQRFVVGDQVAVSEEEGVARVEAVLRRRSWLGRPDPGDPRRELLLAANIDLAVIVVAVADPPLHPGLIDRMLLALARGGVAPALCVNKLDLCGDAAALRAIEDKLSPYAELDLPLFRCSAARGSGIDELRAHLAGKTCVFVGHSGVGKSALLNALDPEGGRQVGGLRDKDGRGRHTTTSSSLRSIGDDTRVIDTPGVRAFGLDMLSPAELLAGFPEFEAFASACRFGDCTHVDDPDCAVRAAAEAGELSAQRYASYLRILSADE